jgi:TRAP-type C4-dicarboxylate transport system permease large subunit
VNGGIVFLIAIVILLVLIALETPVGAALGIAAVVGVSLMKGWPNVWSSLETVPVSATAKYSLFAIPMFILLGCLLSNSGIAMRVYAAAQSVFKHVRGGLPIATAAATGVFSGISGSSAADVATIGRVSMREMRRHGYRPEFAAAVVAAAGAFAALIPPAIGMIIYAVLAEVSVGSMLLAGIIPGLLSVVALSVVLYLRADKVGRIDDSEPRVAPPASMQTAPMAAIGKDHVGGGEEVMALTIARDAPRDISLSRGDIAAGLVVAAVLMLVVLGGIYGGIFTATEAASVGAALALIAAVGFALSNKSLSLRKIISASVLETVQISSMIFLLLVGGSLFAYMIVLTRVPQQLSLWIIETGLPPLALVALVLILLLPLGMFLDALSIMLLTVPTLAPIMVGLGVDGIWFGILVLKMVEIGTITPPTGINVFVISGIDKRLKPERIFRDLVPFVVLDLVVTAILFAFPAIVTFLPSIAGA